MDEKSRKQAQKMLDDMAPFFGLEKERIDDTHYRWSEKKQTTLQTFDDKAAFLREWCKQYEHKTGKWPTVKTVYNAKLPGFISHGEVNIMMRYLNDERKDEQQTGD